mmetsp:Transcript_133070/g.370962  ORF Transcript_133070/g.370962 Transcript_133070/m.370962 type:complete len:108 (-) Transcript_133070:17-340(-)
MMSKLRPREPISMDRAAFTSAGVHPLSSATFSCSINIAFTLSWRVTAVECWRPWRGCIANRGRNEAQREEHAVSTTFLDDDTARENMANLRSGEAGGGERQNQNSAA